MGGKNDKANKCYICAYHHVEIHKGNLVIEGNFYTSEGYQLIYHHKGEESITGSAPEVFVY